MSPEDHPNQSGHYPATALTESLGVAPATMSNRALPFPGMFEPLQGSDGIATARSVMAAEAPICDKRDTPENSEWTP